MEILKTFFSFSDYYGFDYLTATCVIAAMFMLGSKNRSGFVLYCVASTSGIVFAILAKSPPIIVTNIVMIILNVRGFFRWSKNNSRTRLDTANECKYGKTNFEY